jgi:hypothetical protein
MTIDATAPAEEPTGSTDGADLEAQFGPDPKQATREQFDRRIKEGATADQAAGEMLNNLANAAHRGDTRVIYQGR